MSDSFDPLCSVVLHCTVSLQACAATVGLLALFCTRELALLLLVCPFAEQSTLERNTTNEAITKRTAHTAHSAAQTTIDAMRPARAVQWTPKRSNQRLS